MLKNRRAVGIRREDKNEWERRSPLTPEQVSHLIEEKELAVLVQPSSLRAFADREYAEVGAEVGEDLSVCDLVLGVKEMPSSFFRDHGTYAFFAHVVKGQRHNMPMLARMIDLGCNLIEYEKITDDSGRRLVFFGRFAGIAGMVNTLHGLGLRLEHLGIQTPLLELSQTRVYARVDAAKQALAAVGEQFAAGPLPRGLPPLVIGVAGYGHVGQGVIEMLAALGAREVVPGRLAGLSASTDNRLIQYCVFHEEHLVERTDRSRPFDLQEYYQHPERYQPGLERYLPDINVLVNCIYWDDRYPRLVRRDWLAGRAVRGPSGLMAIGDISCDVNGAIEATVRTTDSGEPFFVYDPESGSAVKGVTGPGVLVMAVDNLPCELPYGASREFGTALMPFVPAMARADFGAATQDLALPGEIRRALVLHRGRLTPEFRHLQEFLSRERSG